MWACRGAPRTRPVRSGQGRVGPAREQRLMPCRWRRKARRDSRRRGHRHGPCRLLGPYVNPPRIPAQSPAIRRAMTDQSSVNRQSAAGQSPPIHPGGSGQPRHGSTPEPPPEFPAEPPVNPKRCPVDPPAIPLRIPTRNTRQRPRGNPRGEQLLPVLIRGDARSDEAGAIGLRRIPGRNFNPRIRGADH